MTRLKLFKKFYKAIGKKRSWTQDEITLLSYIAIYKLTNEKVCKQDFIEASYILDRTTKEVEDKVYEIREELCKFVMCNDNKINYSFDLLTNPFEDAFQIKEELVLKLS